MFIFATEGNALLHLFESNLLNWILLVILLAYLWMKATPALFQARQEKIDTAIEEAGKAKAEAERFLSDQTARIANAEQESKKILVEAKQVAQEMKQQIAEQATQEVADFERKIGQAITGETQMAITELRSQAATVAVRLAETTLPGAMTASAKDRMLAEFIDQLESVGTKK